jgi:phosphatidylethanolamine/phosphatidyl-N-methylethanolamine N-methyltransferase
MQAQQPGKSHRRGLADNAHFLWNMIAAPRVTGAVAPSGRPLARAMAAAAGALRDGLVVELGPGTGPVTRALIERGVPRERLALVEYDLNFCRMLQSRFAPVRIFQGDAYDLPRTLEPLDGELIAAFVSSLPLLNEPPRKRETLIRDAFARMRPDGVFVQFTYGLASPVPRAFCADRFAVHSSAPIWLNLPPARVWTYRLGAQAAHAGFGRPGSRTAVGPSRDGDEK